MLLVYIETIYGFFQRNFSETVSVVGISISVYQSYKAKTAAQAAELAAKETRTQFKIIEMSSLLQECLHDADSLVDRVASDNWESASDSAAKIRKNLISIKAFVEKEMSNQISEKIIDIILQFKIINNTSDKARHNGGRANKNQVTSTIRDQIDVLVEIQQYARNMLGQKK